MTLLSVNNLSCILPTKTLFKDASFGVSSSDKLAIIGPNGSGKTTLLSLLANVSDTPHEAMAIQKGLRITYLAQTVDIDPTHTILDHLFQSNTPSAKAIHNYQEALSTGDNESLTEAMSQMDHINAWDYESRVSSILRELDIHDLNQLMKDLSGGMRKKIALAQTFFEDTDLLILDEPTNHLDITTIEWLENMLQRQSCALVMVTHDRYFLDKICTKILEIDQQKTFFYKGNYQTYLEQRDLRYQAQNKQEQSLQSLLRVELAWLKKGPKARSTKQKARKQRIDGLVNQEKAVTQEVISLDVGHRRLGKKILEFKEVSKSFDTPLIQDFSYSFKHKERIGILGPNGAGKTTLLNLIMETLAPDSGLIDVGVNTVFGYFDQHSQVLDEDKTIYEHVSEIGSQIVCHDGSTISAAKLLEKFLFPSPMFKIPISKLSGGEKRRLHLVFLLLKNPNFLLFDEPTNDLDIQTLSVLEDFLLSFSGCLIVISHDRYFMDRVVDKLLVFKDKGAIDTFVGNYTDYVDTIKTKSSPTKKHQVPAQKPRQSDNNKIKKLEQEIERLESDKKKIESIFTDDKASHSDFADAGKKLKVVTATLDQKLQEWETLVELSP
ncbi:ABC transporter ATP-binding protein [Candidatus Marinamargulisbacteria bacterium SCGC AAA071-K20]|nr:ABC transporter ATP-binding protein [Candidatus Marinamargulisbacteria bacterium SCGC AAA071-K20]